MKTFKEFITEDKTKGYITVSAMKVSKLAKQLNLTWAKYDADAPHRELFDGKKLVATYATLTGNFSHYKLTTKELSKEYKLIK